MSKSWQYSELLVSCNIQELLVTSGKALTKTAWYSRSSLTLLVEISCRDILNRVVNYVKRRCERNNLLCRPISTTNTTISRPFFKDKSHELVKVNNHSHFWIFCGPWFVAKTLQLSVYDCQLRTVVSLRDTEVSARGQSPSPLVWHHHMRHTVVQNSSGRQLVWCRWTAALEQAACFTAVVWQSPPIQKTVETFLFVKD